MTYKAAVADLPLGGGKGVIMLAAGNSGDRAPAPRRAARLRRHGRGAARALHHRRGCRDLEPGHVAASPSGPPTSPDWRAGRGGSGDPSPFTAHGVEIAIRSCCARVFGSDSLAGRTVCVAGLGHVGSRVARRCARAGARLLVCDVDPGKRCLAEALGARLDRAR